ncbi:MAG: glycosyltransferase family 2 protein [Alphaproteobacteria bacterium]|nr:glycosyltransferase family 2 protein [Alphaproteobacteria bacterium]
MQLTVSVLLPTYNRAGLLVETIDSLLAQTRPVDEILVIDDGSSDDTAARVAAYGAPVRYIHQPNGGKSSALNLGLAQSTGDLVWICDDDDLLLPQACERMATTLEADAGLGYCAARHEDFTFNPVSGETRLKPPGYMKRSQPDELFPDLLIGCHIFQPGLMVRRTVYDQVGPFRKDLTRSQDFEMLLRVARTSRGVQLDEVLFHHREHDGERGSAAERFSMQQANARWIHFHRVIMENLVPDLDDAEILPASVWTDPARATTRQRTAAIKRATIYARNQLWPEAVHAWHEIAEGAGGPLDELERDMMGSATLYSLGCDQLLDDKAVRAAALALKKVSPLGREMLSQVARSLRWRLKLALTKRQFGRAFSLARFILAAR